MLEPFHDRCQEHHMRSAPQVRTALLGASLLILIVGVLGGIARLASGVPAPDGAIAEHGVIVALGAFGTIVSLVRLVQARAAWSVAGPVASVGACVALVAGAPHVLVATLVLVAGVILAAMIVQIVRSTRRTFATDHMLAGALAWVGAALVWLVRADAAILITWLAGFLLLTIAGERMHLGKLIFKRTARRDARMLLAGCSLALVCSLWLSRVGMIAFGIVAASYAVWLFRMDPSRRMRRDAASRFMSNGVLAALAWLLAAGALWIVAGLRGDLGDAAIHVFMLGFVASMIVAHAPTVLGAVTGLRLGHHVSLYLHAALLHAGVAVRTVGDVTGAASVLRAGSDLTAAAVILFAIATAASVARAARASRRQAVMSA